MAKARMEQPGPGWPERVELGFGGLCDHIAHFYRTKEECQGLLIPFLRAGLEAGDNCVYFMNPDPSLLEIQHSLASSGTDVETALSSGQLVLSEGTARPKDMQARLTDAIAQIPSRFRFLRWAGDMTWSLGKIPDSETLMEWETMCNVIERVPAVFLCQYDLSRFMGSVVVDALKTHPLCIMGGTIHQNPYFEKPEVFLQELRIRPPTALPLQS